MKVHVVSAHFGSPPPWQHAIASHRHEVSYSYYSDTNTPSRLLAMHPRLKAKIPKMLEWRCVDADWYVWLDSSVRVLSEDLPAAVVDLAGDHPLVLFRHPHRNTISDELAAMLRAMRNGHSYLLSRYQGEPLAQQLKHYLADPHFQDEQLFWMGCFAYRREAAPMLQEWLLENITWTIQDQLSFPYVLARSGLSHALFPNTAESNPLIHWDWRGRDQP